MSQTRKITIIGGGQAGLQLGCGLLQHGHEVEIVQNRTAEQIATGRVMSSQCQFGIALDCERELGLDFWGPTCPKVDGITFVLAPPEAPGVQAIRWNAKLDAPAQSIDQRVKIPAWMAEFTRRGGTIRIEDASLDTLEAETKRSDLVVVASGKGEISRLFRRDETRSAYRTPQRALALTYVTGMTPHADGAPVAFNAIPGVGDYFVFPAFTTSGPCDIMVFEGIPGGPMDHWAEHSSPQAHLAYSKHILQTYTPWEAERCTDIALSDDNGILSGCFVPEVRDPVGRLPSGAMVLGLADAVCLNDPLTGQGANNAAKAAKVYLDAIVAHGDRAFDEAFMRATFEAAWADASAATAWTNAMLLPPPPHVAELLASAQVLPPLAHRIANGFNDPRDFFPWFGEPAAAADYLAELRQKVAA